MAVPEVRTFELTATVNFPTLSARDYDAFVRNLSSAVGSVLSDYPTVVAFLVAPDVTPGDVTFGLRFEGADPKYIADMADEILEEAVALVAERAGTSPLEAEREESVLVLA